jgi:hypothetical protein
MAARLAAWPRAIAAVSVAGQLIVAASLGCVVPHPLTSSTSIRTFVHGLSPLPAPRRVVVPLAVRPTRPGLKPGGRHWHATRTSTPLQCTPLIGRVGKRLSKTPERRGLM